MNRKGQLEEINWAALGLAALGAFFAFQYAEYLGTGASLGLRLLTGVGTLVAGYFVAYFILER